MRYPWRMERLPWSLWLDSWPAWRRQSFLCQSFSAVRRNRPGTAWRRWVAASPIPTIRCHPGSCCWRPWLAAGWGTTGIQFSDLCGQVYFSLHVLPFTGGRARTHTYTHFWVVVMIGDTSVSQSLPPRIGSMQENTLFLYNNGWRNNKYFKDDDVMTWPRPTKRAIS